PSDATLFRTWDAQHFVYLASHPYRRGDFVCNQYPLFPFILRAVCGPLGANVTVVGLLLSNLFSLAGILLFHFEVERKIGPEVATRSVALLLAYPGAFFFELIYSESLFFLLVLALFYFLERDRFALASAAAFLLPFTRPVGLFAI